MDKKLKEHAKFHKGGMRSKHMKNMVKFIKEGDSFNKAHDKAVKLDKEGGKLRKVAKTDVGGGKKLPKKYVPSSLTPADRKKQVKSILQGKDRPKVKSFQSKKSSHIIKFEKKYGKKITDKKWINDNILKSKGQDEILSKGRGAYYSGGSRPNQTPESWALARLASVITGGKARTVDKKIWDKYKVKK
tara:strand:- start:205 stop:768 length:564 start_codon:yes stop_codon:yes gene_type:complete